MELRNFNPQSLIPNTILQRNSPELNLDFELPELLDEKAKIKEKEDRERSKGKNPKAGKVIISLHSCFFEMIQSSC